MLPKFVRDYEKDLKEMYIDMMSFLEEDYPDRVPQETTKVVLIDNKEYVDKRSSAVSDSQEHDYVHGKIDSILAYKEEIDVSTVLDPVESPDSKAPPTSPKVLMDGAPGVGKTMLTLHACNGWAENRLFRQYYLVLLVPLRQTACREAKEIEDLLPGDNHDLKCKVVQYVQRNSGKNVAFIFDGYDELSFEQRRKGSLFMKIFRGQILSKCAVLVTSRPYSSGELLKLPSVNRHVEVLGFTKQQIYACIRKRIKSKVRADILIGQLEEREDIASLCYIPLMCIIVIRVFESQKQQTLDSNSETSSPSLPSTMTKLFECFIDYLLRRQVEIVEDVEVSSNESMVQKVCDRLDALEHLAYRCLLKDKFVFTCEELNSVFGKEVKKSDIRLCCLGLLTSSTNISSPHEQHFQFLHLSIQEFLAAKYICKSLNDDDLMDVVCQYIDEPRCRLLLMFVAGITKLKNVDLQVVLHLGWKKLQNVQFTKNDPSHFEHQNLWASKFLYYINLIFESQVYSKFRILFDSLDNKYPIDLRNQSMTLFDCKILAHFFCSIDNTWDCLDMENCSLTVDSLRIMNQVWKTCSSKKITSFHRVNFNKNDPAIINHLHMFPWLQRVQALTFSASTHSIPKCLKSNLEFLAHVSELNVEHNNAFVRTTPSQVTLCQVTLGTGLIGRLKDAEMFSLIRVDFTTVQLVVCSSFFNRIKILEITEVDGLDVLIKEYAASICSSKTLERLTLCHVGLTDVGALPLIESLTDNHSIVHLNLSDNPAIVRDSQLCVIGYALERLLNKNQVIKKLICNKTITNEVAKYIILGLKGNKSLNYLELDNSKLSLTTICNVITVSISHQELTKVNIEGVRLQRSNCSWKLIDTGSHTVYADVFCVLAKLHDPHVKYAHFSNVLVRSCDALDCATLFEILQNDTHINYLTLHSVQLKGDSAVGCGLETMLTVHKFLHNIDFTECVISDSMLKFLEAGLSRNSSLRKLSLKSANGTNTIICVLRALQKNCSVEHLDLSSNKFLLVHSCSELAASEFEKLFKANSTLTTINLYHTCIDDVIASGIAKGLIVNRCLKSLKVMNSMLTAQGLTDLFLSSSNGVLSCIEVHRLCSLCLNEEFGEELVIEQGYLSWPLVQHMFQVNNTILSFKLKNFIIHRSYEIERLTCALKLSTSIKAIDLSNQKISNLLETDKSRDIGIALRDLLENSTSLEVLTMNHCELPKYTWVYAAEGLDKSCSLKCLDVSHCKITSSEASSIVKYLRNVEQLNISGNMELIDIGNTYELSKVIQERLKSGSSKLQYINMKDAINDEIAKKIIIALQSNSSLSRIELSEQHLSVGVVQQFLMLMLQNENSMTELTFAEASFTHNSSQEFLYNAVNAILRSNNYTSPRPSPKLFCGVYNAIQFWYHNQSLPTFFNITSLMLEDIDDDAAIVIFCSLANPMLAKVKSITLTVQCGSCGSVVVGERLKDMLENNSTLQEFSFINIKAILFECLAEGLMCNNSLKSIMLRVVDMDDVSNHSLANVLKAMGSSNVMSILGMYQLPQLKRHSHNGWKMDMECDQSCKYPLVPWFICALTEICTDKRLRSDAAESVLLSCPKLKLNNPHMGHDVNIIVKLLQCLKMNSTIREIDFSGNTLLANTINAKLHQAIKCMLSENMSLEALNLSDAMNTDIADALVAGLEKNRITRSLQVDLKSIRISTLSRMMHFLETHSLKCLTVTGVFSMQCSNDSKWQVRVFDNLLWRYLLSKLIKIKSSSATNILNILIKFTELECVCNGTPVEFDVCNEIVSCQISCKDLLSIRDFKCLLNMSVLRILTLNSCGISDKMCQVLASVPPHLTKLDLSNNHIHESGAMKLCEILEHDRKLQELILSWNNLSQSNEALGLAFQTLFRHNNTLMRVTLKSCNISDSVCQYIGIGMEHNASIDFLDLSNNSITESGAEILFTCLKHNSHLNELNISKNSIFPSQRNLGYVFNRFLQENVGLVTLNLDCGYVEDYSLLQIADGLQRNKMLRNLTLDCLRADFQNVINVFMKSKLVYFNCSNSLAFVDTDSNPKYRIEIYCNQSYKPWSLIFQEIHKTGLNAFGVTISGSTVSDIDFENCHLNIAQVIDVVNCLEHNMMLRSLCLQVYEHSEDSDHNDLALTMENMLKRSPNLTNFNLLGVLSVHVVEGVLNGLQSNLCPVRALGIDVTLLDTASIVRLMKLLEFTRVFELFLWRQNTKILNKSVVQSFSIKLSRVGLIELQVLCYNMDDTLAISLFSFLKDTTCQLKSLNLSNNALVRDFGHDVCRFLKEMLEYNKTIKVLYLSDDSTIKAIADGMQINQSVQEFNIDIFNIGDESFCTLLISLSKLPLTVKVIEQPGQCSLRIMTYISETSNRNNNSDFDKHIPGPLSLYEGVFTEHHRSFILDKVLLCLMGCECKLQELELQVFTSVFPTIEPVLSNERICNYLTSLVALRTLKIRNPLSDPVISGLAARLSGNSTLNHIALSIRTKELNDIHPIFLSLNSSNVMKLEVIDELLLFRDHIGAQWKLEVVRHDPMLVLPKKIRNLLFTLKTAIRVDVIIDKHVRFLELTFPDSDEHMTNIFLKSIENGCYKVIEMVLKFGTDIRNSEDCGLAIKRMLTSNSNKLLKKLTIIGLANDVIAAHVAEGLAQNASLSELNITDQCRCIQHSAFVKELIRMHVASSSICKILIYSQISLQRMIHNNPLQLSNDTFSDTLCDIFTDTVFFNSWRDKDIRELPRDGSWVVTMTDRKSILPVFYLINNVMSLEETISTLSPCALILPCLRMLDLSHSCLTCKQLTSLFDAMQKNCFVINLDVSYSVQVMPTNVELEMYHSLQRMLEMNTTLKVLNLTGIVDDHALAIIASKVQFCSLTSLLINLNPKNSNFTTIEDLLFSVVNHDQFHLQIMNVCGVHVHKRLNSAYMESKQCYINIDSTTSQLQDISSEETLFQSWLILYVLITVGKHVSELGLVVDGHYQVNNSITVKVFKVFFGSVRSNVMNCSTVNRNAAENFFLHLKNLNLQITAKSKTLFALVIETIQSVTVLEQLSISHDAVCSEDQMLAQHYQCILSSNKTLEFMSFDNKFTDLIAEAVALGVAQNTTLKSLKFGVSSLSNDTLTHLLQSVSESAILCIIITEGCIMRREQSQQPFFAEVISNKGLLCHLLCTSASQTRRRILKLDSLALDGKLDLRKSELEHDSVDLLKVFEAVKKGFVSTLVLSGNKFALDQYLLMSSESVLNELWLDNCQISDSDCEHIARGLATNKSLVVLDLHSNCITGSGGMILLRSVAKNGVLQYLDLSENNLSHECLSSNSEIKMVGENMLRKNNSLLKLHLGQCSPLCIDMSFVLRDYTTLKVLSVQINEEELLVDVLYSLEGSQCVQELDISESSAKSFSVAHAIQQLLHNNSTIKTLNMCCCGISDGVCKIFAKGLSQNKHIEKLDLSRNEILGHGLLALFQVLEENKCTLLELNLSSNWKYNSLSDVKLDEIEDVTILIKNSVLKTLIVSDFCDFSAWFGIKLFEGLKRNTSLCKLDISGNIIQTHACNLFVNMLSHNSTLTELNINLCEFLELHYNLADVLLKCSSLKRLTVDPTMEEILNFQNVKFAQNLTVTKVVDAHQYGW